MAELLTPDLCVVGAGPGGLAVAAAAAALGVQVVLVERNPMGGQESAGTSSIAPYALIAAARRAHAIDQAGLFGLTAKPGVHDLAGVREHIRDVLATMGPNYAQERYAGLGVRVIQGEARFVDSRTMTVSGAFRIRARRFVIATGSTPALPPIAGLAATPHVTPETILELDQCPRHLAVIGAGSAALELAQAFRRMGADVTVLAEGEPLAGEDPECVQVLAHSLAREGIRFRTGGTIKSVGPAPAGVPPEVALPQDVAGGALADRETLHIVLSTPAGEEIIPVTHVLLAAGRRPNVDGLGLEVARIKHVPAGILVNGRLQTSNRRVYAIGDVMGSQSAQAAIYHAGLVIQHALFRQRVQIVESSVPRVTFTDPEFAHVGLTEADARARGDPFQVLRWPYRENERAHAERQITGHIKAIVDRAGRILGATIVGAGAGDLISTWSLALTHNLNIRAMAGMVVPYPTVGEIAKRAAMTYFIPRLTRPWVRRIIALLRGLR